MYRLADGIGFLEKLPKGSVDGIFTDPPWGATNIKIQGQREWKSLMRKLDRAADHALKPKGICMVWIGNRILGETVKCFSHLEYKWQIFCGYMPPRYIAGFESIVDPILVYMKKGAKFPMRDRKLRQLYLKASTGQKDTLHPCARPVQTVKQILYEWFPPKLFPRGGAYIVDPFGGSDTTGQACRELRIRYDTCEIDPKMYSTGIHRDRQPELAITF